ncbi:thiamine diphosphokinase [Anaerolineales bacterium HSG24]|nr:thiamine diphosphokinase [Anaerolineales bacterium HSG24]
MPRIIIFANGHLTDPNYLLDQLRPTDRIFCADGGASHALSLGLTPEVVVGDFDSLPDHQMTELEQAKVTLHRYPVDKDKTDLELTLDLAITEQPSEIILVTALGGRVDQMLANLMLLTRPEYQSGNISLLDGGQRVYLVRAHQTLALPGQIGDTLSLLPLNAQVTGVTVTAVAWPLENATLLLGSTLSISNRLTKPQVTVSIAEGMVLVIHIKKEKTPQNSSDDYSSDE